MKDYQWTHEYQRLWDELVPPSGQADTVQGELIRCIGKLTDEAYRNGNHNWDGGHIRMYEYLRATLTDKDIFSEEEINSIHQDIDRMLKAFDNPDTSGHGSRYYNVTEKIVDWCMIKKELIPHIKDPKLKR